MRALLVFILLALSTAAFAQFNRCGLGFCPGGDFGRGFPPSSTAAVPGCASPTAPDGVVDFSKCSNAFYVAVIF